VATHWQPAIQEEIRGTTTNQDHSGSRVVDYLDKQVESGQGRKSQGDVLIT
jgi:hypothetical protein